MADSFFAFDTSLSNLNDDEGGGEGSEDEYDALNDETFGQDSDAYDWEVEHEQVADQIESSRRRSDALDASAAHLEASLSQLVLDEAPRRSLGSSVWRHDAPFPAPAPARHTPVPTLKNVCTVEEIERQLRQQQQQQPFGNSSLFAPRFPVILQRPPGLLAPVPLPFAPQQGMTHSMNQLGQMNQPLNKIIGPNTPLNQMSQTNLMQNQMGQNVNQLGPGVNQMGQGVNQMGQMGQNVNQFLQNVQMQNQFQGSQMGQNNLNISQNVMNQMNPSKQLLQNTMNQNVSQIGPNMNQIAQNVNQMQQNVNQMSQKVNQFTQSLNQLGPSLTQMNQNMTPMSQSMTPMNQNMTPMSQSMTPMNQSMSQMNQNMTPMNQNLTPMNQNMTPMNQNMTPMNQNMTPMNQNVNQMGQLMSNGGQFNSGLNQYLMGQPRILGPPPGLGMPGQNFSPNVGQFNPNFRAPSLPTKPNEQPPLSQQNMLMNQQMLQMKSQSTQVSQKPTTNQVTQLNQPNQPMTQTNQASQTIMNQKPVQNPTPNQLQNQRIDQKVQKSRVYNNSKNVPAQNVTSQNLVQLIQNTHPMLNFNNGFHNANHHPMLNNRNTMFQHNQYLNNQIFNSQRHNGTYSNNNRHMNGDDSNSGASGDEYAGLMSSREKQWLINIQMLQLNTGTPYIHDFYYTVFLERQASKEKEGVKEAHKANQQNHPFYSGVKQEPGPRERERERHNSARHNSTSEDAPPREYVPTQFENSLGKLQCGSVTAPRKIIDVEVVAEPAPARPRAASVASTNNPAEVPREMRRTKQLLLDIEALYLILLRLEELNDPLAISNALILKEREEKQKQLEAAQREAENEPEDDTNLFLRNIESVQRRPKQDSPKSESVDKRQVVNLAVSAKPPPAKNLLDENKDELMDKMFVGILQSDRLAQMLTVRKGKALLCRFLLRVPAGHALCRGVWARALRALPSAARRDDGTLAALAAHYSKYIHNTVGWSAVLESCSLLAEALDPARTPHALTTAFTLSCVCSLIEKASTLINTPEATSNERQWSKFLKTLARALKNTTLIVARPLNPLPEHKLMHHLKQLESRSTIEILQRGKPAEFADVTKNDVSEQLMKYLC